MSLDRTLQALIEKECSKAHTHGVILCVQSGDGQVDFKDSAGDATPDTRFPIASMGVGKTWGCLCMLVTH